VTGLGKAAIYKLLAQGWFPRSVKLTAHAVGWVEDEVQAWLGERIERARWRPSRDSSTISDSRPRAVDRKHER
jgi:prophage regulatory protein